MTSFLCGATDPLLSTPSAVPSLLPTFTSSRVSRESYRALWTRLDFNRFFSRSSSPPVEVFSSTNALWDASSPPPRRASASGGRPLPGKGDAVPCASLSDEIRSQESVSTTHHGAPLTTVAGNHKKDGAAREMRPSSSYSPSSSPVRHTSSATPLLRPSFSEKASHLKSVRLAGAEEGTRGQAGVDKGKKKAEEMEKECFHPSTRRACESVEPAGEREKKKNNGAIVASRKRSSSVRVEASVTPASSPSIRGPSSYATLLAVAAAGVSPEAKSKRRHPRHL